MRQKGDLVKESKVGWVAKKAVVFPVKCNSDGVTKRQTEPNNHPNQTDYAQADKTLEHGGDHVLLAHHSAVEERQSGGHEEHQTGGSKNPSDIGGLKLVGGAKSSPNDGFGMRPNESGDRYDRNHDKCGDPTFF